MKKIGTFIFLLTFLLSQVQAFAQESPFPLAQKGVLDLRHVDLNHKLISLNGEWGFYWNNLFSPGNKPDTAAQYVAFPSLWNKIIVNSKPLPSQGYATYELLLLLPKNRPVLAMEVPDTYCSYNLYINDTLLLSNGRTGKTPATSSPFWNTKTARIFPDKDTLHFLMQVSNFWHTKGGTYKSIQIGPINQLIQLRDRGMAFDLVLMGCLFMGGLFFLGLYFFGRRDIVILYFSLFCILYSYRMVGTDHYVLHTLFPNLNWILSIKLEYLTLAVGVGMFAQYTRHLFPEDISKKIMNIILAFCLCYAIIILFTPPLVFTRFLEIFLVSMFVCAAYSTYVYIQAMRHKRVGSIYAFSGIVLMMSIFIISNLNYFGVIPTLKGLIFGGYILFFFLQSLALSHRFAQSFREATMKAQQGLKIKSEFLSTMSHEIRTPLNAVIGMTHVLLQKEPRKDQQENLDVLLFSANNLLSIVNNILDYNKIEAGKITFESIPMDIRTIAKNIVAGLKTTAEEKEIDLRLEIDPVINDMLMGDPTRFSQVVNNLLHNALKFTREGWVCLKLEATSISKDAITIKVNVEDTGIGIEKSKQDMIFERFSQAESSTSRSYGGTGLGLAISKRILQLQHAELEVNSTPGKGSCFFFTQTFLISKEKAVVSTNNKNEKKLKGVNILLVEDQPFNVLLAQTILQGWGAKVDVATNGQEALDMLDPKHHQLVLMDIHMPVMDGYEATERLRQRGETLPIIALTANTPGEIETDLQKSGLTDIVVKPFNPDDLYHVIIQHISS